MIGRAFIFVLAFGALELSWQTLDKGVLGRLLIDQGVVAPAAYLIHALTPHLEMHAAGNRLWEANGGINIVNGCDGTETLFLLGAGFAAAPLPLRARIRGLLVGIPLVYLLNLGRILVLFYAHHDDFALFDFLHGVVTPAVMVISIAAFYYVWLHRFNQHAESPP